MFSFAGLVGDEWEEKPWGILSVRNGGGGGGSGIWDLQSATLA